MGDLSTHFSKRELQCKCGCGKYVPNEKLLKLAEAVRIILDCPMTVTSSTRCKKHNASPKVGGEPNSNHLQGEAMDFICRLGARKAYDKIIAAWRNGELPLLGGIGLYVGKNFIHIDVTKAADGHLRRWNG